MIQIEIIQIQCPVAWGFEFGQWIPCTCRKRRLIRGYQLSYTPSWLIVCLIILHVVGRIGLDSWALGCSGSGNTLFQRQMSFGQLGTGLFWFWKYTVPKADEFWTVRHWVVLVLEIHSSKGKWVLDRWAPGCSGSGNTLFQRQMSFG